MEICRLLGMCCVIFLSWNLMKKAEVYLSDGVHHHLPSPQLKHLLCTWIKSDCCWRHSWLLFFLRVRLQDERDSVKFVIRCVWDDLRLALIVGKARQVQAGRGKAPEMRASAKLQRDWMTTGSWECYFSPFFRFVKFWVRIYRFSKLQLSLEMWCSSAVTVLKICIHLFFFHLHLCRVCL